MNFQIVSPILGFDSLQEVTFSKIDEFFATLEKEGVSFTLIDPSRIRQYSVEIPLFYKNLLKIEEGDDVRVYCTMIVDSVVENSMINFVAPVILNFSKKLLVQVALDNPEFQMAQPLSSYL